MQGRLYTQTSLLSLKAKISPEQVRTMLFEKEVAALIARLPAPALAEPKQVEAIEKKEAINQGRLMTALLLTHFRLSLQAGCDCMQVPLQAAQEIEKNTQRMRKAVRASAATYGAPVLESALKNRSSHLMKVVEAYAAWLVKNAAVLRTLQPALLQAIAGQLASLEFTDRSLFDCLSILLQPWSVIGMKGVFRPGRQFQLARDPSLHQLLNANGIAFQAANSQSGSFGSLSFLLAPEPNTPARELDINKASPRKFGLAGSLVIAGILYALNFNQEETS